jgi:hypothetical protein
MSSYNTSASSSGWKPGKNKTILTPKTKSKNPVSSKTAMSWATGPMNSSGYGHAAPTKKSKPKPKRKPISTSTAASFVGSSRSSSGYGSQGKDAQLSASDRAEKARKAKAAAERQSEASKRPGRGYGMRKSDVGKSAKDIQKELKKKESKGNFKGKFVGPDRFKGDLKKIAAWRAAGRKY